MSDDSLFHVCAAMLNTLHDGHADLTSSFNYGFSDTLFYRNIYNKNFNSDIVRQNGGGSDQKITRLLSIFDCHGQPLYYVQHKAGPGHTDFTDPVTIYAPAKSMLGDNPYTKPVAVLIDRGSFSATSYFAICRPKRTGGDVLFSCAMVVET